MSTLDRIQMTNGFTNSSRRPKNASFSCVDSCEKTILLFPTKSQSLAIGTVMHLPGGEALGARLTDHPVSALARG